MKTGNHHKFFLFIRQIWSLLKDTYAEWSRVDSSVLGAALAFYTIFSLAPVFIIVVAIVGIFLGKESVQVYIVGQLAQFVGQNNAANIFQIIQNSYKVTSGFIATVIAIILILIGSTTALAMLKTALDTIWEVQSSRGLLDIFKSRLKSFFVVLLTGPILFISMILTSFISTAQIFLEHYVNIPIYVLTLGNNLLLVAILTFLFTMLFKILPDAKIRWGDVWVGGVITAILFALGKYLLGLYLGRSTITSAYGAAGSLVVFLMWVYYSAQILIFGAAFIRVYVGRYGSEIIPKEPQE